MRLGWIYLAAACAAATFVFLLSAQTSASPKHKPVMMTRFYTGPDRETHAEEVEAKFTGDRNDVFKLMAISGAEIHRAPAGAAQDFHVAPRRQYIITLSGQGELEIAGGKKIRMGPGHISLVEDTTGKGHITRTIGTEDRVTLTLPISEQASR